MKGGFLARCKALDVTIQSNFLLFVPEFLQHHLQPSASLLACVVRHISLRC
ncbi:hypothetical protein Sjap_008806 [Stephania japonica]|uniref:Uncharacterized protein n=1 Tax=Stephania japonica TaxID=461633 RepID=A0AAP0JSN8_9MAGN